MRSFTSTKVTICHHLDASIGNYRPLGSGRGGGGVENYFLPFARGSFLSPTSSGATMQHVKVGRLTKTGSKERSGTVQKLTFKSFFEVLSMNNVTTYCTFIHLFRWSGLTFLPTDLNEDKIRIPFFFFQGQPVAVVQISSCTGKLLTTSEVTGISPQLERYYFHHAVEIHSSGTEKDRALHT